MILEAITVPDYFIVSHPPPPLVIAWEKVGFGIGFAGVFFIYLALALRALAKKYNVKRRWRAWIPLVNWFLLIDIAGKSRFWKFYIFVPTILLLVPAVLDTYLVPEPFALIWALFAAFSFFAWLLMLMFSVTEIAKRQKYPKPLLWGALMAFGQPVGMIFLGILAWGKRV